MGFKELGGERKERKVATNPSNGLRFKVNTQREFVAGQAEILKRRLATTGLSDIPVAEQTEIRDADYFADRKTLGIVEDWDETTVLTLASSAAADVPVSWLLVSPSRDGQSNLSTDRGVYSDTFWVAEDGGLKHLTTDRPVPLDGLQHQIPGVDANFDIKYKTTPVERSFDRASYGKQHVKDSLAEAGIAVPKGIYIQDTSNLGTLFADFDAFTKTLPPGNEVVVKPHNGVRGDHVVMGHPDTTNFRTKAVDMFTAMSDANRGILVEERIIPPPQQALADLLAYQMKVLLPHIDIPSITGKDVDYNFRVLTTVGLDAQVIDAEIRYSLKTNNPVNVSKGALAVRTEAINDPALVEKVYKTATDAVTALYRNAYVDGDPTSTIEYVGVDVIPDGGSNMYVLEVQRGPQGFSTLARMDREPLEGIAKVLLPGQEAYLDHHFSRRLDIEPNALEPVPATADSLSIAYSAHTANGNYREALRSLEKLAVTRGCPYSDEDILGEFAAFGDLIGSYRSGLKYVSKKLEKFPDDPLYSDFQKQFEEKSKNRTSSKE